jgi:hypothetical protein
MALSAPVLRDCSRAPLNNPQVVTTAVVYPGGYTAVCNRDHGTSGSRGRAKPWAGLIGEVPAGFCNMQTPTLGSSSTGTTGDTGASPIVRVGLDGDPVTVRRLPVSNLAGTIADMYRWVYATADGTFDISIPALPNRTPVGRVVDFISSALADVEFFGAREMALIALGGGGLNVMPLQITPCIASTGLLHGAMVMTAHGRIRRVDGFCTRAPTDADVSISAAVRVTPAGGSATAITGGAVVLLHGDACGDVKAGSAVTDDGGNVFHPGDSIDVYGTVTAAGTATDPGTYNLAIQWSHEPGL